MASCDAQDVQLKLFSPVKYRRTREKGKGDATDECYAKSLGLEECPPDLCRCSGVLRKRVETPPVPWGTRGATTEPDKKPPKWTPTELKDEEGRARRRRADQRPGLIQALEGVLQAAANEDALGSDEIERIRELDEWVKVLRAEK